MIENAGGVLNEGETVYFSGGLNDKAVKVTKDNTSEYLPLQSNQEEEDTGMIIHAAIASINGAIVSSLVQAFVLELLLRHKTNVCARDTVESQWLEHLRDHGNSFETLVVLATEG